MTNADRIRLHELIYARASLLEAAAIAEELSHGRYPATVTSALIAAMAVAYYRPFMGSRRPDGTKVAQIEEQLALELDKDTHLNLKRFRHEACAHKDLSPRTMNIPIVKMHSNGALDIHSLLPVAIDPEECARIQNLCTRIVEVLVGQTGALLKGVKMPAAGTYTLNHEEGDWLVPLDQRSLDRANLDRE